MSTTPIRPASKINRPGGDGGRSTALYRGFWHGTAWYPELWPDLVSEDLRRMGEVGINLVRVGEFAWSVMEPREGRYDLGWLHEAMDACHRAGIRVMLCTPTATPPRWMSSRYPEILRVDMDGQPLSHGSRQHASHVSARYRAFSRQITAKLGREFGNHPALLAWQIDNEFLNEAGADFHPEAKQAWALWLRHKYRTIEALNRTWGTRLWSQEYPSFAQVPMPVKTPLGHRLGTESGIHHPSLVADWLRFTSDTVVAFQNEQVAILRRLSATPITHNHVSPTRVWSQDIYAGLDCAATDIYSDHASIWGSFQRLDLMRGAKLHPDGSNRPYMILETAPSQSGGRQPGHKLHPDGFLPVEAMLFLGMGGNTFAYWLWRQQRVGAEMCHGSILQAWGEPSLAWKNVRAVSDLLAKIKPLLAELPPAPAQIALHDSPNAHAWFQAEPLWRDFSPSKAWAEIYPALLRLGYWRDVRFESAPIDRYRVVLSPFMPVLTNELVDRMERFVHGGGTWVVGPMSGCRTPPGTLPTDAGLGRLDGLAGVKTRWAAGLENVSGQLGRVRLALGWYCFGLEKAHGDCRVLGRYAQGPATGDAWCVERRLGKGRLVLLAAHAPGHYQRLLAEVLKGERLTRLETSWGTTLIPREGHGKRAWLVANWDGQGGHAILPTGGRDLISGRRVRAGRLVIRPFECLAIVS